MMIIIGLTLLCFQTAGAFGGPSGGDRTIGQNFGAWWFEGGQKLKNGMISQTFLMYHLSEKEALEFSIGRVDTSKTVPPRDHQDGTVFRINAARFFPLNVESYAPFLVMGVGASTIEDREHDIDPVFEYGAGLQYHMTDRVSVRSDLRHVYNFRWGKNNLSCTVGIAVQIGKSKAGPNPEPAFDPFADIAPDAPSFGILAGEDGKFEHFDLTGHVDLTSPELPAGVSPSIPIPDSEDGEHRIDENLAPTAPEGVKTTPKPIPPETMFGELAIDPKRPRTLIVLFENDKAEIPAQYAGTLEQIAEYMKKRPAVRLAVSGHTDSIGPKAYNLELSQKRSRRVMAYMTQKFGLSEDRFVISWFGEEKPLVDNSTEENRKRNRRTEITFEPPDGGME